MTTILQTGPVKQAGVAEEPVLIEPSHYCLLLSFLEEFLSMLKCSLQFLNSSPETKLIYTSCASQ